MKDSGLGHRQSNRSCNLKAPKSIKPRCNGKECERTGKSCNQFSDSERNAIFTSYWEIGNLSFQREYITRRVRIKNKERTYTAKTEDSRRKNTLEYSLPLKSKLETLCKVFFLSTLAISEMCMSTSLKKIRDRSSACGETKWTFGKQKSKTPS